ncbi:unannotated protein [freshwater metagenome]|uniref:Unannotated protein n=1 Tax=freshwater metagenome TaxID=449393 RepID=A0A6J6YM58_9ZZZZ
MINRRSRNANAKPVPANLHRFCATGPGRAFAASAASRYRAAVSVSPSEPCSPAIEA